MIRNYTIVALRNLAKHRLYSFINIFGLAVGLASCILILLFVRDEMSYDAWIPNADRIYRIHARFDVPGRDPFVAVLAPAPAVPALQKDFPEIESAVRLRNLRPTIQHGDDVFFEPVMLADAGFFDVFDLPMAAGDRTSALKDPNAILLSEKMAKKYFGDKPAVGEVLAIRQRYVSRDMRVVGVFKDLPHNTHLKFDFLARLEPQDFKEVPALLETWTALNTWNYIKLRPGADIEALRRALPEFEKRNVPDETAGGQEFKTADFIELSLMNLRDLHLHAVGEGEINVGGSIRTVTTFSIVAAMIVLIACINFTNLATARASQRAREVALRKVLGATRGQLIIQFLGESVIMAEFALVLALAMVELALPFYAQFLDRPLTLGYVGSASVWPYLAGLMLVVGVVAFAYPAVVLSGFRPARILRANKAAAVEGSGTLRGGLVVLQFAISIGLIVCTVVVYGQTLYVQSMDVGFERKNLMVLRNIGRPEAQPIAETLRQEIARVPGVTDVALSDDVPTDMDESNTLVEIPGTVSANPILISIKNVDYEFFSTYRIPVIAGRALARDRGEDDFTGTSDDHVARGGNIVINRLALGRLGFATPEEAVGRQIRIGAGEITGDDRMATMTIVGVVENFNYRSARDELAPTYFVHDQKYFQSLTIRYEPGATLAVRDSVGAVWRALVPAVPYTSEFVSELMDKQYGAERSESAMFAAFAGLAIIVACLGLYGLASFTAERRTKEIGVRKVLGARVRDILRLLVWDFSKPVLLANILAWPVAWWLMRDWLDGFIQRIDLGPAAFIGAGMAALIVAWVTVTVHAAGVARANPIHALRYE